MIFNETYRKYTWELFPDLYKETIARLSNGYHRFLHSNGRILLHNGVIHIETNQISHMMFYT